MRQKLRDAFDGPRGRYLSEAVNWSPAVAGFLIFLGNSDLLFLTYAVAFAMYQQFGEMRKL